MDERTRVGMNQMFLPHRNLSDAVNGNIIRSEIEGGVYLKDLPDNATLEIETQNRRYRLHSRGQTEASVPGRIRDGPKWTPGHRHVKSMYSRDFE